MDPKQCIWTLTAFSRSISAPGRSAIHSWPLTRDGRAHRWTHLLTFNVHRSRWVDFCILAQSFNWLIDHPGVPTIRFAQKHGATNLLNLSTVATFFSAVTATTLQFSYALERTLIADTVNSFWFASLVFSIGAAVNSLLGLTWKQAM